MLARKIRDETPLAWKPGLMPGMASTPDYETQEKWIEEAEANLALWLDYACDGDLTLIPGRSAGPWKVLSDHGHRLYRDAAIKWEVAVKDLEEVWKGQGHAAAEEYLDDTQKLVEGFCPAVDGSDSGLITQVALALQDAYATVSAFKMDLYKLAKQASDQLDDLDHGSGELAGVALMVTGLAIEAIGSVGQASNSVFGQAGGGVATALGDLVFQAGKTKFDAEQPVGGGDPQAIMDSLVKATKKAAEDYSTAAEKVGNSSLSRVWRVIDGMRTNSITPLRPAAAPESAVAPSATLSGLFPS
ncbi:hypothetical protein [Amycolatopsis dongchuanensis]